MSNKITNLDVSLFTLGGVDFLERVEGAQFDTDILDDLCRGVAQRYGAKKGVKKEFKFSCDILQHVSSTCASGLSLSAFTWDGSSVVSEIESFDLDVTTEIKFGDGATEVFRWPQPTGTDYEIQVDKLITSNADWIQIAMDNNVTSIEAQLVLDVAGIDVSLPMLMSAASHSIDGGEMQMEKVVFKKSGTPTVVTGDALLIEILTGDAYLAWAAETGAGDYSGNAIMSSAKLSVKNGALIKSAYEFFNQGAPSYVAA